MNINSSLQITVENFDMFAKVKEYLNYDYLFLVNFNVGAGDSYQ